MSCRAIRQHVTRGRPPRTLVKDDSVGPEECHRIRGVLHQGAELALAAVEPVLGGLGVAQCQTPLTADQPNRLERRLHIRGHQVAQHQVAIRLAFGGHRNDAVLTRQRIAGGSFVGNGPLPSSPGTLIDGHRVGADRLARLEGGRTGNGEDRGGAVGFLTTKAD